MKEADCYHGCRVGKLVLQDKNLVKSHISNKNNESR